MPYSSMAQSRFMHSQHPDIASRWDSEMKRGKKGNARKHPIKAAGLPQRVGKAASSGTFTRGGSTVVPMAQKPARRGQLSGYPGAYTRGSRVEKGQSYTPTPVLLAQGNPPSGQQGAAGAVMPTLAGQRTGAPVPRGQSAAQAMTGASGQQAAKKPAQIGQAAQQKPTGTLVPVKAQTSVTKADLHPDQRLRSQTPFHGRRPRQYDPESRRQRRLGAATATSAIAGGYAGQKGVRQVVSDSRRIKGGIKLKGRAGALIGAGAAGLGGGALIARRAEDPRKRKYT